MASRATGSSSALVSPVSVAEVGGPDEAAHHLGVARLRQRLGEADVARAERLAEFIGHAIFQHLPQFFARLMPLGQHDKGDDFLTFHLMRHADGGALCHGFVRVQDRLHLGWTQAACLPP